MMEIKTIGDILKCLSIKPHECVPDRLVFELSEDKAYYNVEIYTKLVTNNELFDACIKCKTRKNFPGDAELIWDNANKEDVIFTITPLSEDENEENI